jgi:methionyl-tRNA formyltransferase
MIKIAFLGTPIFAAKVFESMYADKSYEICGVITQPDRPAGRKLELTASEVKKVCQSKNIEVLTTEKLSKDDQTISNILSWKADVAVVVAFGQILNEKFLTSFPLGAVNIHASLLPRWRGAAPIQRAIEAGDSVTGVCLQKIVKELDAGDIIAERLCEIDLQINSLELHNKLIELSCDMMKKDFLEYCNGKAQLKIQDINGVTYAKKIEKLESLIDWNQDSKTIHNKVRAFAWGPGCYFVYQGKRVKVHKTLLIYEKHFLNPNPGVIYIEQDRFFVKTADGAVELLELQMEGKQRQASKDFLRSFKFESGQNLI